MTGGLAVVNGKPSIIEVQFSKIILESPNLLNITVVSVGRGRIHTAGDVLGEDVTPFDRNTAVELVNFAYIDLSP